VTFGWFGLQAVEEGGVPVIGGQYAKPFALSTKAFLVSAGYDMPTSCNFAACYVDVWGNRELLHRELTQEVFDIFPVKPRAKPPVLPDTVRRDQDHAVCYLDDVYADLPGVERGQVRWLRICQMLPWVSEIGQESLQWHPTANPGYRFGYGTCGPVRVVGLVPVASDGSAHFQVPPDCDLYFQALDANFMAVQRMRTHVEFKPGEFRGCTGCHETRSNAVRAATYRKSQALAKPAVRPLPPPWGDRTLIDFERHIQPILAQKCASCHGAEAPKAGLVLTEARDEHGFLQSYRSMFGLAPGKPTPSVGWGIEVGKADKPEAKAAKAPDHPWWKAMTTGVIVRSGTKGEVTKPLQFGAVNCPLVRYTITTPDHRALLTDDEVQLLATWADVQVPYFSSYVRAGKRVEVEIPAPFGADRSPPRPILPVR
jgi:hypothetical protein